VIILVQGTRWYGLTAKSPQEYFNNNCHTYSDISNLIDKKGTEILRDIKPCFESFISENQNDEVITDELFSKLILINDHCSIDMAKEAMEYTINHLDRATENSGTLWYIWLDTPEIERQYRLGKVNESTTSLLNSSLDECALRVAGNLTTYDTDKVYEVANEFSSNVSYSDIIHWSDVRENIMKSSPNSVYIGDLIVNMSPSEWRELALEGVMSNIDISLESVTEVLEATNPSVKGTHDGFRAVVNDIWAELADTKPEDFDTAVESLYYTRRMTITVESYIAAIKGMLDNGCLPALEGVDTDSKLNDLTVYLKDGLTPATEGLYINIKNREYNMDRWKREKGHNILYVTGFSGSGKSTYASDLERKTPNCIHVDMDQLICVESPLLKFGDTSKFADMQKRFFQKFPDLQKDNTWGGELSRVRLVMEWLLQEAANNPSTLYIFEGIWVMEHFEYDYLKDKPVVIIGTSPHNSLKRREFRGGRKLKDKNSRYQYVMEDRMRKKLIEVMDSGVTESMLLADVSSIDLCGKVPCSDSDIRALEAMSFMYIPAIESRRNNVESSYDYEDKVHDQHKASRNIRETVATGKQNVGNAYKHYKDCEDEVDATLTHMIKSCKNVVLGDPKDARRKIVEGNGYSVVQVLKYALGGYAVFSVSKIAFFLILITRWCNSGKIKRSEKRKILMELENEKEMLEEKIKDAEYDGNREAKYALMRNKQNVENAIKRIKRRYEADSDGIGAKSVLIKR
jgi:hypothetical protein